MGKRSKVKAGASLVSINIIHNVALTFLSKDFKEGTDVNIDLEGIRIKNITGHVFSVLTYDCYWAK